MLQNLHKNTSRIKEIFLFLPTAKLVNGYEFMVTGSGLLVCGLWLISSCHSEWVSPRIKAVGQNAVMIAGVCFSDIDVLINCPQLQLTKRKTNSMAGISIAVCFS